MTNEPTDKLRALFLAALMVLSVFAFTISFAGSAGAANAISLADSDSDEHLDSGSTFWQGQDLLLDATQDGTYGAGDTLQIRSVNEDDELTGLETEFTLDSTGTKNISTENLDAGEYVISDGSNTIIEVTDGNITNVTSGFTEGNVASYKWEVAVQSLSAEFDDDDLPVDTGESATIEMDSNRGEFDVDITAEGLDEEDLEQIFNQSADGNTFVGAWEDDEEVTLTTTADGEIEANFTEFDETGDFTFDFEVNDTTASASASVTVQEEDVELDFVQSSFTEQTGDEIDITISLEDQDEAYVFVGGPDVNYLERVHVVDDNEDGEVVLTMNTFTAGIGSGDSTESYDVGDDDELEEVTRIANSTTQDVDNEFLYEQDVDIDDSLDDPLTAGTYDLTVSSSEDFDADDEDVEFPDEEDVATLNLQERSTDGISVWSLDSGQATFDEDDLYEEIEERMPTSQAAVNPGGDRVVIQVNASGLYGHLDDNELEKIIKNDTENEGVILYLEQSNEAANQDAKTFDLGSADGDKAELYTDPDNETLFVVLDLRTFPALRDGSEAGDVEDGERYDVAFQVGVADNDAGLDEGDAGFNNVDDVEENPYVGDDEEELVATQLSIVETDATFNGLDANDELILSSDEDVVVTGTTTVAPGTNLSVRLRSEGNFLITAEDVEVQSDRTWRATFDLSDVEPGANFTATVRRGGSAISDEVDGQVLGPATASVTFNDQESANGEQVVVASVTMSRGGFIAIHSGSASGPVIGSSKFLSAGTHSNVRIALDEPISEDTTLVAMPHRDDNHNNVYDFPEADAPYVADGSPVTDSAEVSYVEGGVVTRTVVGETPTPMIMTRTVQAQSPTPRERTVVVTKTATPGQPGFGVAIAVVALLAAALLAIRRRD